MTCKHSNVTPPAQQFRIEFQADEEHENEKPYLADRAQKFQAFSRKQDG